MVSRLLCLIWSLKRCLKKKMHAQLERKRVIFFPKQTWSHSLNRPKKRRGFEFELFHRIQSIVFLKSTSPHMQALLTMSTPEPRDVRHPARHAETYVRPFSPHTGSHSVSEHGQFALQLANSELSSTEMFSVLFTKSARTHTNTHTRN